MKPEHSGLVHTAQMTDARITSDGYLGAVTALAELHGGRHLAAGEQAGSQSSLDASCYRMHLVTKQHQDAFLTHLGTNLVSSAVTSSHHCRLHVRSCYDVAGVGAQLLLYDLSTGRQLLECTIFLSGQHIHGLKAAEDSAYLIAFGGRELQVASWSVKYAGLSGGADCIAPVRKLSFRPGKTSTN